jgi:hypothetical protein
LFVKVFGGYKHNKVLIIRIDFNNIGYSTKIILLFFKSFDNYYKFFIVYRVVKFRSVKFLRIEGNRVKLSFFIFLT